MDIPKVLVIGHEYSGKTSIIKRLMGFANISNILNIHYIPTIGVEASPVFIQNNAYCLWDVAGRDNFSVLTDFYYENTQKVLIVCDATNGASFDKADKLITDLCANPAYSNLTKIIVINKTESELEYLCDIHKLNEFLSKYVHLQFLKVSAKTGDGIEALKNTIA